MEAIKKNEHIEIDGVVLTKKTIDYLRKIQNNENLNLRTLREDISDAVCFLSKIEYDIPDEETENAFYIMHRLSVLRSDLEKLKNPYI